MKLAHDLSFQINQLRLNSYSAATKVAVPALYRALSDPPI